MDYVGAFTHEALVRALNRQGFSSSSSGRSGSSCPRPSRVEIAALQTLKSELGLQ